MDCIRDAYPFHARKKGHPAKKTFQAMDGSDNELKDIEKVTKQLIIWKLVENCCNYIP